MTALITGVDSSGDAVENEPHPLTQGRRVDEVTQRTQHE